MAAAGWSTRPRSPATPEPLPTLALTCFGPAFGLPSISPQCTHMLAYLHFCGLRAPDDFALVEAVGAKIWPHTALPVLTIGTGRSYNFSEEQFEALATLGYDVDGALGLDARERADNAAYAALVMDALMPALLHAMWLEQANYEQVTRPAHAARLPFPHRLYHPWQMQRRTFAFLSRRGLASPHEAQARAVRALDALAIRLGGRPYFSGERPGSLDAAVFAYLVTIQRCPLPADGLRRALGAHGNLCAYCDRCMATHFSDAASVERLQRGALEPHLAAAAARAAAAAQPAPPPNDAAAKRLRERQRSRHFVIGAVGAFVAYVVANYLPAILSAIADASESEEDDDEDEE